MAKKVNIEELNVEVQTKLGIDLMKYRNEEVAENIIDMLVFPIYAISWIIRPVLIAIIIYIAGFFILDLSSLDTFAYAILGLLLFLLSGLFAGLLYFIRRLKKDISGIIDFTMILMKSTIRDSEKIRGSIPPEQQTESMNLLFKGIIHIVILPVVSKVLSNKIPILGMMVSGFVERILSSVASRIDFDNGTSENIKDNLHSTNEEEKDRNNYEARVDSASSGITKIVAITTNIARYPLAFIFWICFIILLFFIYIIN